MATKEQTAGADDEKWYLGPMTALAAELNVQSGWTWSHSGRVARYAVAFGRKLGLDEAQMMALQCAALLHDVGKVAVPAELLNKVSKLTRDEWYTITKHPMASAQMIKGSSLALQIAGIARSHHEWFNGEGYPLGLKGDAIPLGGRVLSIADACDAMSSDRPYRSALSPGEIVAQIEKGAGVQFDPALVGRLRPLLQTDLEHMLPGRPLRVVSDDVELIQQLWFALYPQGWDIEIVSGNIELFGAWSDDSAGALPVVTIIDALAPSAPDHRAMTNPQTTIIIDGESAGGETASLQRPLDLAEVLGAVHEVEETTSTNEVIKVLLADPYHLFRQVLKRCLEEAGDVVVVAEVDSASDFRRLRAKGRYDVAVVASDMLAGTFTTGTLRPNDVLLTESEAGKESPADPPVIVLVSDEDAHERGLAAKIWQPGASISTPAYIYRGAPAEIVVEAVRTLAAEASWPSPNPQCSL